MRGSIIVAVLLLVAPPLLAHSTPVDHAWLLMRGTGATLRLTLPAGDLAFADLDHDGSLSAVELDRARDVIEAFVAPRVEVANESGEKGSLTFSDVLVAMESDMDREHGFTRVTLVRQYLWNAAPSTVTISISLAQGRDVELIATDPTGAAISVVLTPERHHATLRAGGTDHPFGGRFNTAFGWRPEWNVLLLLCALCVVPIAVRRAGCRSLTG